MRGWGTIADGFATRELRLFMLGCAATSFALWAFTVVLAIAAYREGRTAAVTLAVVARVVPAALAAPLTALFGDRHSRRTLLLLLATGSSALLAALTLAVAAGAPFAVVLTLTAVYSALTTGQRPAQAALLPGLVDTPYRLAAANGLWNVSDNGAYFVGALTGGAAAAGWSPQVGFALTAAACAVGALAFAAMRADLRPPHRAPRPGASVIDELLLGTHEVRAEPELRETVGLLALLAIVDGALDVLIVLIALQLVDSAPAGSGCSTPPGARAGWSGVSRPRRCSRGDASPPPGSRADC